MITCTRRIAWDAAHRVLRHESRCAHLHGHRYTAEITCEADQLDHVDRVVDFGSIKEKVGAWVAKHWDHATLVNRSDVTLRDWLEGFDQPHYAFAGEPTAENIARELFRVADKILSDHRLRVVRVRVWETPNCWAEVTA